MANFTEKHEYKLEIIPPYSTIQCRCAEIILKDGVEVARSYHRSVFVPGSDISEAPDQVKIIAGTIWTPEVVDEFEASLPDPIAPDPVEEAAPEVEPEPEVVEEEVPAEEPEA